MRLLVLIGVIALILAASACGSKTTSQVSLTPTPYQVCVKAGSTWVDDTMGIKCWLYYIHRELGEHNELQEERNQLLERIRWEISRSR